MAKVQTDVRSREDEKKFDLMFIFKFPWGKIAFSLSGINLKVIYKVNIE